VLVKLKGLFYLLILLVASAALDDAWARVTSDPLDGVLAAQNIDYVSVRLRPDSGSPGGDLLPDVFVHLGGNFFLAGSSLPLPLRAGAPPTPSRPDLLYVLMSLQR